MFNYNSRFLITTIFTIVSCFQCVQGIALSGFNNNSEISLFLSEKFNNLLNEVLPYSDENSVKANNFGSDLSSKLNVSKYPGELCNRVCKKGEKRICYFEFTLELYHAMGVACGKCRDGVEEDCKHSQCIVGDGFERGVMSINRQIPGPAIQVCKDDLVVVDVHNKADGTSASLHWHGLHMVNSPHMDGVPFVTQCPIQYSNSFRYKFNASEAGTQFYHSHSALKYLGHHKANGQYGVLTVRQPEEKELLSFLYDYDLPEHHVFIADWMHTYAEHLFPGLPSTLIAPDSVLINGRGIYTNPQTKERSKVMPTVYYVTTGRRYLFRLVNSASHYCPFSMQIENHSFFIVSSDSHTVLPRRFDTLISNAGERYDFILEANQKKGDYWMRIRGLGFCSLTPTESYALIRYMDDDDIKSDIEKLPIPLFPSDDVSFPEESILNHPNATCWKGDSHQCITELTALDDDEELHLSEPDYKLFLGFDNHKIPFSEIFNSGEYFHFENFIENITLVSAINNLSFVFPNYPPLTQPELIDESQFCDENNRPADCNETGMCVCVHRLKVKTNSIVELIIVDETDAATEVNHPFHLHGYRFMVTGIGQSPEGVPLTVKRAKILKENNILKKDLLNVSPPFKDTVSIPSRGYAVVRLRASNPGFWLMHCHYEWHLAVGMGLILQVGELSEMVKPPKNFPKCGNFLPNVELKEFK